MLKFLVQSGTYVDTDGNKVFGATQTNAKSQQVGFPTAGNLHTFLR